MGGAVGRRGALFSLLASFLLRDLFSNFIIIIIIFIYFY